MLLSLTGSFRPTSQLRRAVGDRLIGKQPWQQSAQFVAPASRSYKTTTVSRWSGPPYDAASGADPTRSAPQQQFQNNQQQANVYPGQGNASEMQYQNRPSASYVQADAQQRVFVKHAIYKKRSAMQMSVMKPKFVVMERSESLLMKSAGGIMLEFAAGQGERQYDWARKQTFLLSATEAIAMTQSADTGCSFFHDPNKGRVGEGTVGKQFNISPTPDASGYFINLAVKGGNEGADPKMSIMVSHAEFGVMRGIINYLIPHITGFSAVFEPVSLRVEGSENYGRDNSSGGEWSQ